MADDRTISEDLERYSEVETAAWVLGCSEDELVRVCSVADWLTLNGPTTASGSSMILARACALAAVYVHEGAPRELKRKRRMSASEPTLSSSMDSGKGRWVNHRAQDAAPRHYGVGVDARKFWGT